jgi:hypothetical protein
MLEAEQHNWEYFQGGMTKGCALKITSPDSAYDNQAHSKLDRDEDKPKPSLLGLICRQGTSEKKQQYREWLLRSKTKPKRREQPVFLFCFPKAYLALNSYLDEGRRLA